MSHQCTPTIDGIITSISCKTVVSFKMTRRDQVWYLSGTPNEVKNLTMTRVPSYFFILEHDIGVLMEPEGRLGFDLD